MTTYRDPDADRFWCVLHTARFPISSKVPSSRNRASDHRGEKRAAALRSPWRRNRARASSRSPREDRANASGNACADDRRSYLTLLRANVRTRRLLARRRRHPHAIAHACVHGRRRRAAPCAPCTKPSVRWRPPRKKALGRSWPATGDRNASERRGGHTHGRERRRRGASRSRAGRRAKLQLNSRCRAFRDPQDTARAHSERRGSSVPPPALATAPCRRQGSRNRRLEAKCADLRWRHERQNAFGSAQISSEPPSIAVARAPQPCRWRAPARAIRHSLCQQLELQHPSPCWANSDCLLGASERTWRQRPSIPALERRSPPAAPAPRAPFVSSHMGMDGFAAWRRIRSKAAPSVGRAAARRAPGSRPAENERAPAPTGADGAAPGCGATW
eukprot:scaffold138681_cov28-Tisochrysis_lutea.AAC.3